MAQKSDECKYRMGCDSKPSYYCPSHVLTVIWYLIKIDLGALQVNFCKVSYPNRKDNPFARK